MKKLIGLLLLLSIIVLVTAGCEPEPVVTKSPAIIAPDDFCLDINGERLVCSISPGVTEWYENGILHRQLDYTKEEGYVWIYWIGLGTYSKIDLATGYQYDWINNNWLLSTETLKRLLAEASRQTQQDLQAQQQLQAQPEIATQQQAIADEQASAALSWQAYNDYQSTQALKDYLKERDEFTMGFLYNCPDPSYYPGGICP